MFYILRRIPMTCWLPINDKYFCALAFASGPLKVGASSSNLRLFDAWPCKMSIKEAQCKKRDKVYTREGKRENAHILCHRSSERRERSCWCDMHTAARQQFHPNCNQSKKHLPYPSAAAEAAAAAAAEVKYHSAQSCSCGIMMIPAAADGREEDGNFREIVHSR